VADDRWYDLKVTIHGDVVECFIDGQSMLTYKIKEIEKRYVIAGLDQGKNEIVVKVVNAEPVLFKTSIELYNSGAIESRGEIITLSAKSKEAENTFKDPTDIYPKTEEYSGFSNNFSMEFKPYSLTVLRIKRK